MIYRHVCGERISALGLGAMRLPVMGENNTEINDAAVAEMVAYAMENGINYYDTAWGYHGGKSEISIGGALAGYARESFYLADKFPGYDLANFGREREIFPRQLEKCGVSYFDFYLLHNVCEKNIDLYLKHKDALLSYLLERKKEGAIRHLGFSVHANTDNMLRFLEAYGEHMEFCQIQLNYLDWNFQAACEKVEILQGRGIPIFVMEPVRGGKLATLDEALMKRLAAYRPNATAAEWAFRFLQGIKGVGVTLSGMSNMTQLKENVATFSEDIPVNDAEKKLLFEIADEMVRKIALPCTACRYCIEKCPKGLDIPYLLELYNEHSFTEGGFIAPMALEAMPREKHPDACIGCHSCEKVCPQGIKIAGAMSYFAAKLRG
ncbi:MAG: oxidoreductase [Ruminococcaceae bacterium]|nr:oxidoreductase [Oscillospiraceae bacterium]